MFIKTHEAEHTSISDLRLKVAPWPVPFSSKFRYRIEVDKYDLTGMSAKSGPIMIADETSDESFSEAARKCLNGGKYKEQARLYGVGG